MHLLPAALEPLRRPMAMQNLRSCLLHFPTRPEDETGVHCGQGDASDGDHGALEDHEGDLVIGQFPVKTALEFGDAEAGADVDGQRSDSEC